MAVKPVDLDVATQLQGYRLLGDAVDQIRDEDVISPLPDSEPSGSGDYASSRIRTIRNRLANLGYLKSDSKSASLDEALKRGITRFQQDVANTIDDFTVDGWVGEHSWAVLQELVSFEEASHISRWFKAGEPCPALIRATQLRLFTLGLIDNKPGTGVHNLNTALQKFCTINTILAPDSSPLIASVNQDTVALIFDQDALVKLLANAKAPVEKAKRMKIHLFVMNVAKIELWMLGFGVKPDGSDSKTGPVRTKNGISVSLKSGLDMVEKSPLCQALIAYWKIHTNSATKAKFPSVLFVKKTFPSFFRQLLKDTAAEDAQEMDADEVYVSLEENHISMDTVWQHVKAFGSRLWDGVKRVWGWFKNMATKTARIIASFVKNLSRLAYQYILRSYEAIKAVVKGFCDSVSYLVKSDIEMPEGVNTMIRHDGDFDFKLLIDDGDQPKQVLSAAEMLAVKARIFSISSTLLSALIAALKSVATGIIGWAWMLMGLLRLYKCIADVAPELIALQKKVAS